MHSSPNHPSVSISDFERSRFRALHTVLERVRPQLGAALEETVAAIPVFAQLIQATAPSAREAQETTTRMLERAALLDGDWEPYAAHLRELGSNYAHMGVAFHDWHALLRPYREVIEDAVLPSLTETNRAALSGMHLFLDRSMAAIADAYITTKEQLVLRAEAQLSLYAQMFRDSPLGKLIYEWEDPPDPSSFRLIAANAQATTLSGPRALDELDRTLAEAGPAVMQSELPERFVRAMETGEPERWTARWMTGSDERVFDCHCFRMGARTVGVVFQDVTARDQMQASLARYTRELERSNRDLDEFAYVASHDLKAPLRDVDTLSGWIVEDVGDTLPSESQRHLQTIRDRIGRMERLLDDLLQYSRAGRLLHAPEAIDLRRVVANVLAVAPPPEGFQVVVKGDPPPVRAPRVPLELVLRNLVTNAVKHHHEERGQIEIELATEPTHVAISVRDDGPGIAPELHERVFRMFQTLRPRDDVEGSGMGLAIVKRVVEAHDGQVTLASAPGQGTTIRFTWPREWHRSR